MGYGRSKPQPGSQLRCDGLGAGLRAAMILNEGAGSLCRDAAMDGIVTLSGHTWTQGDGGKAVRFAGGGIGTTKANVGIGGVMPRTLAFVATCESTGDQSMAGWGPFNIATGFYGVIYGGQWYFNAINSQDWGTGVSPNTRRNLHVLTYDGANVSWSINGVSLGSAARTLSTTDSPLHIGCRDNSSSFPMTGTVEWAMVWNRVISRQETAQLMIDPFAMFRPRVRRVYSIPSGGTVASRLLNLRRKVMVAA